MSDLHCLYFKGGKCTMKAHCIWQERERDKCKVKGVLERDGLTPPAERTYLLQNEFTDRVCKA